MEEAGATLVRELREELNAEISVGPLLWVVENFFTLEKAYHEIGFYFQAEFTVTAWLDKSQTYWGIEEEHSLLYRWFPLKAIGEVTIQPAFLREALKEIPATPRHLINRG